MLEYFHKSTGERVRAARITFVHPTPADGMHRVELQGGPGYVLGRQHRRPASGDYVVDTGSESFPMTEREFEFCYEPAAAVPEDSKEMLTLVRLLAAPRVDDTAGVAVLDVEKTAFAPLGTLIVPASWCNSTNPVVGGLLAIATSDLLGRVSNQVVVTPCAYAPPETGEPKGRVPRPDGAEQVKLSPELGEQYPKKITREALLAMLDEPTYEVRKDGRTTVCELTFKNGFSVRGESACACASEFKELPGQTAAFAKALDEAWGYAGFMLREDRYRAGLK